VVKIDMLKKLKRAVSNSWTVSWIKGDEIAPHPWLAYINPTNVCNQNCRTCALRTHGIKKKGYMDDGLFKSIVDQLFPEVQRVYLMKQGEPLLHPKITRFAQYLKEKRPDIEIAMHTNASMLTREKADALSTCMDFLTISIHTARRERYKTIHGGKTSFDQVIANFSYFVEKCHAGGRHVKLYLDYVRQRENQDESESEIIETFKKLLPDVNIGIHNVFSFQNTIDEGKTTAHTLLSERDMPICFFPWVALCVCHDGNISYCITEPIEEASLGDAKNQSLKDIWNGHAFQLFRRKIREGRLSSLKGDKMLCRECSWLWSLERIHHHLVLERDEIANRHLIGQVDFENPDVHPLSRAYALFLKGKIDLAETEALRCKVSGSDEAEEMDYLLDLIYGYRALWKNRELWRKTCTKVGEKYEEFNNVIYT
jgi:MoaA/NifB/PqqE/SkfB family radical SAM enzyme